MDSIASPAGNPEPAGKSAAVVHVPRYSYYALTVLTLPRLLGAEQCRSLTLLDVGAGDGMLGHRLEAWSAKRLERP